MQEFISAINFSYDGVWITDGEGETLFVNNSISRITKLEKKGVEGRNMKDLVEQGVFDKSATLIAMEKKEVVTIIQKVH
ncbi:PAS domain-containing protein, partial [Pantoea sp. SIMBA_133]